MKPCTNPSHFQPSDQARNQQGYSCRSGQLFPCHNRRLPNGETICESGHHTHPERSLRADDMDAQGAIALLRAICFRGTPKFRMEIFKEFWG